MNWCRRWPKKWDKSVLPTVLDCQKMIHWRFADFPSSDLKNGNFLVFFEKLKLATLQGWCNFKPEICVYYFLDIEFLFRKSLFTDISQTFLNCQLKSEEWKACYVLESVCMWSFFFLPNKYLRFFHTWNVSLKNHFEHITIFVWLCKLNILGILATEKIHYRQS